jgi:hypothetical protein
MTMVFKLKSNFLAKNSTFQIFLLMFSFFKEAFSLSHICIVEISLKYSIFWVQKMTY